MKNVKKILAAVLVAGAASLAFAAPAHADNVHVSLNLGNGGHYQPAPVVRPVVVRKAVVYRPVYRPAPRVVYVQPRHWEHRGHWRGNPHDYRRVHVAYGYGRGW